MSEESPAARRTRECDEVIDLLRPTEADRADLHERVVQLEAAGTVARARISELVRGWHDVCCTLRPGHDKSHRSVNQHGHPFRWVTVEATEVQVARLRALADQLEAAADATGSRTDPHIQGEACAWRSAVHHIRQALDGANAKPAPGSAQPARSPDEPRRTDGRLVLDRDPGTGEHATWTPEVFAIINALRGLDWTDFNPTKLDDLADVAAVIAGELWPPAWPRVATAADLGLTAADLMAIADQPGPSVAAECLARAGRGDAVSSLRELYARWYPAPATAPECKSRAEDFKSPDQNARDLSNGGD